MRLIKRCSILVALGLPLYSTLGSSLYAQTQDSEKVVVTGSHIKRVDLEGFFPITVIDSAYIETSGATTTYELLQMAALNGGGTFNEQFTIGFTPGSAAFDLRGFGPERTLVLLNGRRLPVHPFGAGGTTPFIDLNIIPISIIQRIEILKDGASAIYGSDAIAGVVNIITEAPEVGVNAQVRAGTTTNGGGTNSTLNASAGWNQNRTSFSGFMELSNQQAIQAKDRSYASSFNGPHLDERSTFSNPGTYYYLDENDTLISQAAEGCRVDRIVDWETIQGTYCAYDPADKAQLSPAVKRTAIGFSFGHDSQSVNTHIDYMYSRTATESNGFWFFAVPTVSLLIDAGHEFNPINQNIFYERAFTELGSPTLKTDSDTHHIVATFDGMLADFEWEFANQFTQTDVNNRYTSGWASASAFETLVDQILSSNYNPFQPLSSQQQQALSISGIQQGQSKLVSHSATIDGPIANWSAGELWLAAGLELRSESLNDRSDDNINQGEIIGLGRSRAKGARDAWAGYAELVAPISESVQLTLAGRLDHYDDFGTSFNPKVSMSWRAHESLKLRGSWGTGYRAPGLHQLYSEDVLGSVGNIPVRSSGNPDLEAEESESFTLGAVWQAHEDFSVTLDAWSLDTDNLIAQLGVFTILTAEDDQGNLIYADLIEDNGVINDVFLNVAGLRAKGFDLSFNWQTNTETSGSFKWKTDISHLSSMEQAPYPGADYVKQDGQIRNPKDRLNSLVTWQLDQWTNAILLKYIGDYQLGDSKVSSWTTLDFKSSWKFSQSMTLGLGIKNLMDKAPPTESARAWPNYDQFIYNPQGRAVYLQLDMLF